MIPTFLQVFHKIKDDSHTYKGVNLWCNELSLCKILPLQTSAKQVWVSARALT